MPVSSATREHLHKVLDELLDDASPDDTVGVLFIREIITQETPDQAPQHALLMRGVVPNGSLRLSDIIHLLRNQ